MKSLSKLLVGLVSLAVFGAAFGQAPVRVRGTITALNGDVLSVKDRGGKALEIHLAPDAQIVTPKKVSADEFKEGSYVGVTSIQGPGGQLVAKRVHALGPQVPQMHGDWDSIPHSKMTNANIAGIAKVKGGTELTMKYKDGEQKILTNAKTEYYNFDKGSRDDLKPGAHIFTGAQNKEGQLVTGRVVVSKNGVNPPQ